MPPPLVAPLLSSYKVPFALRRWLLTLLGGVHVQLPEGSHWLVYLWQFALALYPWILSVPFTVLSGGGGSPEVLIAYGGSAAAIACALRVHTALITHERTSRASRVRPAGQGPLSSGSSQSAFLDQSPSFPSGHGRYFDPEDEPPLRPPCDPDTVLYVIPPRGRDAGYGGVDLEWAAVFQALFVLPLAVGAYLFLDPSTLRTLGFSEVGTYLLHATGYLATCIGLWSLIGAPPPEPSIDSASDYYNIDSLSRPLHLAIFFTVNTCNIYLNPDIRYVNYILHIVFAFLPLMWALGILAPVRALLSWAGDQLLIFGAGGTAASSDGRMAIYLVQASATIVACYLLAVFVPINCFWILAACILSAFNSLLLPNGRRCTMYEFSAYLLAALELAAVSATCSAVACWYSVRRTFVGPATSVAANGTAALWPFWMAIALLAVRYLVQESQKAYIFFGTLLNPRRVRGRSKTESTPSIMLNSVLCRLSSMLITFVVACAASSPENALRDTNGTLLIGVWLTSRSARWAWQSSWKALVEMVAVMTVTTASDAGPRSGDQSTANLADWWTSLGFLGQLTLAAIMHDRAAQAFDKTRFWIVSLAGFFAIRKLRRPNPCRWALGCAVSAPITAAVIMISSVFSSPVTPLFGLPFMSVGFPRPVRTWRKPGAEAATTDDTPLYEHLSRSLSRCFSAAIRSGSLGQPSPGDHYLGRLESRLVLVQVLEAGSDAVRLAVRGLELQATSCHAVEALAVDEICEDAHRKRRWVNGHWWNSFQLLDVLRLETFSESTYTLTGVLDNPETLQRISTIFLDALVWVFSRMATNQRAEDWKRGIPFSRAQLSRATQNFPWEWLRRCMEARKGPRAGHLDSEAEEWVADLSAACYFFVQFSARGISNLRELPDARGGAAGKWAHQAAAADPHQRSPYADSPENVYRTFAGQISEYAVGHANWWAEHPAMAELALRAYRMAVKIGLDEAASQEPTEAGRLETMLEQLSSPAWKLVPGHQAAAALRIEPGGPVPSDVYTLVRDAAAAAVVSSEGASGSACAGAGYSISHRRLQPCDMYIGSLSSAAVQGVWASLAVELLYLTNDDEERYSVQAHPLLLRNLVVQAAEAPLGYPVYCDVCQVRTAGACCALGPTTGRSRVRKRDGEKGAGREALPVPIAASRESGERWT